MDKYRLIPKTLLAEGTIKEENIFPPHSAERWVIELTHTKEYIDRLLNQELTEREIRKIGFPQSSFLVEREFQITQGTIQGALYSLEHGAALNIAGGTHHAYPDRGEGFCLFNDAACAANYLLFSGEAKKILIVDLDVHQGNGSAVIFQNEPRVFTFSMHGAANYPLKKEKSDLDIPLKLGMEDREYITLLLEHMPKLIDIVKPDFIFYISGVDVLKTDKWGRLGLSIEGAKQRDEIVLQTCSRHQIPVMVAMGGGYSPDISDIVNAHCNTFRLSADIFG